MYNTHSTAVDLEKRPRVEFVSDLKGNTRTAEDTMHRILVHTVSAYPFVAFRVNATVGAHRAGRNAHIAAFTKADFSLILALAFIISRSLHSRILEGRKMRLLSRSADLQGKYQYSCQLTSMW